VDPPCGTVNVSELGVATSVGAPLATVKLLVITSVPPADRVIAAVMLWLPLASVVVSNGVASVVEPPAKSHGAVRSVLNGVRCLSGSSR
jgi:hypothetical protein